MSGSDGKLSISDLYILMDSYKNNIQLNTTLLEQQKQLLIMNDQALEKQKEFCNTLDKFVENLTTCSERLTENHNKIVNLLENKTGELSKQITEVSAQMITCSSDHSIEHSKIMNRLWVSFGGMITIIISIIGLAVTYADKIKSLSDIIKSHIGK